MLFETQRPLLPEGVTVERYSSARGVIFEKHVTASGRATWYKVMLP